MVEAPTLTPQPRVAALADQYLPVPPLETEEDPLGLLGMEAFLSPSLVGKTPATATFPKFQRADSEQLLKKERAATKPPKARLQGREKCIKVRRPIT